MNNFDGDAGVGPRDLRARLPRVGFAQWCEYVSEEGTPYYHNKETNETTWEKPIQEIIVQTSQQGSRQSYPYPHLWREVKNNEGPPYYFNPALNQTQWEAPPPAQVYRHPDREFQ